MAAPKQKSVEHGGMVICDAFKLFPVDDRNWELCELRTQRDGSARWMRCGRFYSYNTVGEAIAYVADILLKRRCVEQAQAAADLMAYHRETMEAMTERLVSAR